MQSVAINLKMLILAAPIVNDDCAGYLFLLMTKDYTCKGTTLVLQHSIRSTEGDHTIQMKNMMQPDAFIKLNSQSHYHNLNSIVIRSYVHQ